MTMLTRIVCFLMLFPITAWAQMSNSEILEIKDRVDAARIMWTEAFEEGVRQKSFSGLASLRGPAAQHINNNLLLLRKMYSEGDGRPLLTAVMNYLRIQQQFVSNVMSPAESINPEDTEAIEDIRRQINNFSSKEKSFLIDINNALRSSAEPMPVTYEQDEEEEEMEELSAEEKEKAAKEREKRKPRRKNKLPHEMMDDDTE